MKFRVYARDQGLLSKLEVSCLQQSNNEPERNLSRYVYCDVPKNIENHVIDMLKNMFTEEEQVKYRQFDIEIQNIIKQRSNYVNEIREKYHALIPNMIEEFIEENPELML